MNSNPKKSAQPCGCDEGASYMCEMHHKQWREGACEVGPTFTPESNIAFARAIDQKLWRKQRPLHSGVLAYFPDALMEVAHVSYLGNAQHNPGQPLHWSRDKSADHLDCIARHITDHTKNPVDEDGALHLAKAAWRALAELQLYLEKRKA